MSKINLLPWREELKKEKNIEFAVIASVVLIVAAVIALAVYGGISVLQTHQKRINTEIETEINTLKAKIKKIEGLKKTEEDLERRINSISALQEDRPRSVMLFNELIKTLPDDLYLKSFKQEGTEGKYFVDLTGVARRNRIVSEYMENLEKSTFFGKPDLKIIKGKNISIGTGRGAQTIKVSDFQIRVDILEKEEEKPDEAKKKKKKR